MGNDTRWRTEADEKGNIIWYGAPVYPPLWTKPEIVILICAVAAVAGLMVGALLATSFSTGG